MKDQKDKKVLEMRSEMLTMGLQQAINVDDLKRLTKTKGENFYDVKKVKKGRGVRNDIIYINPLKI